MKLHIGCFALMLLILSGSDLAAENQQLPVVPYPQEVVFKKGSFSLSKETVSVRLSGVEGKSAEIIKEQLSAAFLEKYGAKLIQEENDRPTLWIGLPSSNEDLMAMASKLKMVPDASIGDEGYLLKVEKKHIYILANTPAGAFMVYRL